MISVKATTYEAGTSKKQFWQKDNGKWSKKDFTLRCQNERCLLWVEDNLPEDANKIDNNTYLSIINKFAQFYDVETELFGDNFGYEISNPEFIQEVEDKVSILVSSMEAGTCGYFYSVDLFTEEALKDEKVELHSNNGQILYLNYTNIINDLQDSYLTVAHEFQHLLGFIHDAIVANNENSYETWYTEMLSVFSEDLFHDIVKVPSLNTPLTGPYDRLETFLNKTNYGVTFWGDKNYGENTSVGYAVNYAFGAYLIRNYGGVELLKKMTSHENKNVNKEAINYALKKLNKVDANGKPLTFDSIAREFYQVIANMDLTTDDISDDTRTLFKKIEYTADEGTEVTAKAINLKDYFSYKYEQIGDEILYPYGFYISKIPSDCKELTYEVPDNEDDIEIIFK